MLLKENDANKDEILCGINEETIKINLILYNCFMVADLKGNERQMFQWVLAETAGHKKREVELNIRKIAKEIDRSRSFVYKSLQRLVDKKMIFITEKDGKLSIYLNTMPDTWNSVGNKVKELINEEYSRLSINM
jgi:predicted transcriptional regulator